jgi:hypothetical protein
MFFFIPFFSCTTVFLRENPF